MKRKLLLAVPVAATIAGGAWAGSTMVSGKESRAAYERVVADLNEYVGLTLVTSSYTPGFLRSEAITDVRWSGAADGEAFAQLRHVIEHSPVGAGAELSAARVTTTLVTDSLKDGLAGDVLAMFNGAEPVQLLSQFGFGGTVSNEFTVAPIQFQADDGTNVSSEAAVWNFDITDSGGVSGAGNWGGANVGNADMIVTIAATSDSFDYKRVAPAVYTGNYDLVIPEAVLNYPSVGMSLGARGMGVNMSNDVQQGLMSSRSRFSIADIDAPIALDSVSLEMITGGLDTSQFVRLRDLTQNASLHDTDALDEGAFKKMLEEHLAVYADLIKAGAYLGYELDLTNTGGAADADIRLTFKGDGSTSGHDTLESPDATVADLMRALNMELNVNAPADVLMLTPAALFLDPTALAPWLTVGSDNSVVGNIVIDDLVIDANGQPLPLEMMLGEMLNLPLDIGALLSL